MHYSGLFDISWYSNYLFKVHQYLVCLSLVERKLMKNQYLVPASVHQTVVNIETHLIQCPSFSLSLVNISDIAPSSSDQPVTRKALCQTKQVCFFALRVVSKFPVGTHNLLIMWVVLCSFFSPRTAWIKFLWFFLRVTLLICPSFKWEKLHIFILLVLEQIP